MTAPTVVPADRLSLLYHLSQDLNSSLDLDGVLDRVMDEVMTATRAEHGLIALVTPDKQAEFYAARGWEGGDAPEYRKAREWVEGIVRDGSIPVTADGKLLCIPIQWKGGVVGYIYADKGDSNGTFTADDLDLVEAMSAPAASPIENARLFGAVENQMQELRLLQDITQDLTSTLDLERVLTGCLTRVQEVLKAMATHPAKLPARPPDPVKVK